MSDSADKSLLPLHDTHSGVVARERRIQQVVEDCLCRRASGALVSDEQLSRTYPELMPDLGAALRGLAAIERARHSSSDGNRHENRAPPGAAPPDSFPGYELLHEIHRGGQGIVYRAQQKSTGRQVALKMLLDGAFAGQLDRARFEREVRLLAALKHPNIVAIHDSGSFGGRFFFVMDYIAGQPLDTYMGSPRRSIEHTLRVFCKICDAVNAAHVRGVIHRDLKPANIRVDDRGEPYILDFGLAKLTPLGTGGQKTGRTDESAPRAETLTGQFIGSLPWAAPEQAEGRSIQIDTRTDVYSLGVVLYQILTGAFPYSVVGSMHEVVQHIVADAPLAPRKLRPEIDSELETIVLKCLNKERERRYQTAGELGRDIERYLRGDPIDAKRDSLPYLLRKAVARHRTAMVITALFTLVLLGAVIVSTSLWRSAAADRDDARRAHFREQSARRRADDEAAKATSVNDFLQTMLSSADPELRPGDSLTVRELLDETAGMIEKGALAARPSVEAGVRLTLGRAYLSLARLDEAHRQFEQALSRSAQADGLESEPYAQALRWMGVLQRKRQNFVEAESLQRQALALFQRLHPGDYFPLADSMGELALVLERQGRRNECTVLRREATEMMRRTLGPDHVFVAAMESLLAGHAQDPREALDLAQHSLQVLQEAYSDENPAVFRAWNRLAGAQLAAGDRPAAQTSYEQGLALARALLGDEHPDTLNCVEDLAFLYRLTAARDKSLALYQEFLPAADKAYGPFSAYRLQWLQHLAAAQRRAGDVSGSEQTLFEALEVVRQGGHARSPREASVKLDLVELLLERGACAEAAALLEEAWAADEEMGARTPAASGRYDTLRGEASLCHGLHSQAEALLLRALQNVQTSRMAGANLRRRVVRNLVRLYEAWESAEPGLGHREQAAAWLAELDEITASPEGSTPGPSR